MLKKSLDIFTLKCTVITDLVFGLYKCLDWSLCVSALLVLSLYADKTCLTHTTKKIVCNCIIFIAIGTDVLTFFQYF